MLPTLVLDMLRDKPSRFGKTEVFLKENGEAHHHSKWLRQQLAVAHERSGVEQRPGPYPCRHTYISLALAAGAAPIWVAKQAGHDVKTMVEKYASWIRGREEAEAIELDKIYGKRTNGRTDLTKNL